MVFLRGPLKVLEQESMVKPVSKHVILGFLDVWEKILVSRFSSCFLMI